MISANSIREHLSNYIIMNHISHSKFSEQSGINSGTLSRIIHGKNPISVRQLEAITSSLGVEADYFFTNYVEECFMFSVSMRRIRPFIFRCIELGRMDCVERIVDRLLEQLTYIPALFDLGEELYRSNHYTAAALIFRGVSEAERYQHSERLAMCQYRLFRIGLGDNIEENHRLAMLFEVYVNRLDEFTQLDALKHLIHVFVTVHKWNKVDHLAQEMHNLAARQYQLSEKFSREDGERITERPLYFYILYAWLIRADVYKSNGDYNTALDLVSKYASGEQWIRDKSEEAMSIINQFKDWATANTYLYKLMSGEVNMFDEYADYVAEHKDEVFIALHSMVKVANQLSVNIDHILERFSDYIPFQKYKTTFGYYDNSISGEKYVQFLRELGGYYLKYRPDTAVQFLLDSLKFAIEIKSSNNIIASMSALIEKNIYLMGDDVKENFYQIMEIDRSLA